MQKFYNLCGMGIPNQLKYDIYNLLIFNNNLKELLEVVQRILKINDKNQHLNYYQN